MIYEQGDIIELDFDPTKGHEPAKRFDGYDGTFTPTEDGFATLIGAEAI